MRTCRFCHQPLPVKTGRQRFFCPDQPGRPRCRDLARKEALKGKGNPDLLLKNCHRFAPVGAVGFRLRLVQDGHTWTGPRLGIRSHKNAAGKMRQGDFYGLEEQPRVPKTAEYFIDYVDANGALVLPIARSPLLKLQATGGTFKDAPSESMRVKIKCVDEGRPLPPARKRVFELARELGLMASHLLRELPKLGIRCDNVQNSLGQDQIDLVLRHYSTRLFGPGPNGDQEKEPSRLVAPAVEALQIGPSTVSENQGTFSMLPLDECLPVPPMIRPEHDAAHTLVSDIIASASSVEQRAMTEIQQQSSIVERMGSEVDFLAGIGDKGGASAG